MPPRSQVKPITYILVSGISLFISIALLIVLLIGSGKGWFSSETGDRLYYVLLIPLGASVAAFTFGGMRSHARIRHVNLPFQLEIGGPLAAVAIVVYGGFWMAPTSPTDAITIRIYNEDTKMQIDSGSIVVYLGADSRKVPIAPNGEANLKEIPRKFFGQRVKYFLDSSDYEPVGDDGTFMLETQAIEIKVKNRHGTLSRATKIDIGRKLLALMIPLRLMARDGLKEKFETDMQAYAKPEVMNSISLVNLNGLVEIHNDDLPSLFGVTIEQLPFALESLNKRTWKELISKYCMEYNLYVASLGNFDEKLVGKDIITQLRLINLSNFVQWGMTVKHSTEVELFINEVDLEDFIKKVIEADKHLNLFELFVPM